MIAPPPYTPIQLSHHMPPPIYGDDVDDPTYKEMIVIMGGRGGGKSYFINQMVGGDVAPMGDGNTRCKIFTKYVHISLRLILNHRHFDLPGGTDAIRQKQSNPH